MALIDKVSLAFVLVLAAAVLATTTSTAARDPLTDAPIRQMHEQWMTRYARVYNSTTEKERRYQIFKDNVARIDSFNAAASANTTTSSFYKLGVNQYGDMTNEEFVATKTGLNGYTMTMRSANGASPRPPLKYANVISGEVPATMDWREKGAVTAVKNQGQCGSCWAFSAVAAVEGINQITNGELVALSEQELVDCDRGSGVNNGCRGGLPSEAFQFIVQNLGGTLATEADYPYTAVDGSCKAGDGGGGRGGVMMIKGYEEVPENNEQALLQAVANQPISVAIDARGYEFQFYESGVYNGKCGNQLNHAVTAVGYGEMIREDGTMKKYWLVKNSWGEDWGENGYIKMERDVAEEEGICGIAMQASYPTA